MIRFTTQRPEAEKIPSTHGEVGQSSTSLPTLSSVFTEALQQKDLLTSGVPAGCLPTGRWCSKELLHGGNEPDGSRARRGAQPGTEPGPARLRRRSPRGPRCRRPCRRPLTARGRHFIGREPREGAAGSRRASPRLARRPPALPAGRRRLLSDAAARAGSVRAGRALHRLRKHGAPPRPALTCGSLPVRPAARGRPAAGRAADDLLQDRGTRRVRAGPGRAEPSRAGPPLTSTGLGLLRTGSRRASTPRQACSASSSGPTLSGCESATIRQGVPRCERPGSGWLPPGSMRGAAGAQPPRPYGARPPPRATLPAAAILQRADWRRATGPARPAPPFRGRRRYLGDGGWGAAGRAAAAAEMPRPPRPSARGAAHAASP